MTITFLDPRDQSQQIFSTEQIKQFIKDLKAAFSKKIILDKDILADLLAGIRQENKNNVTIPYLYIDIDYFYVPEIVNLAEQHDLPISLSLSQLNNDYEDMTILFRNKQCLKSLSLGPQAEYELVTEQFIDTLLTTDIYNLSLKYITPEIDIFFRLITVDKLVKLKLNHTEVSYPYYTMLNELLKVIESGNKLEELIINDIILTGTTDINESNTTYLATLIQENVNLEEINFWGCYLSSRFLTLLFQKLLQLENRAAKPLKLNLGGNRDVRLVLPLLTECLAANVAIRDLELMTTSIDESGARLISTALAQNHILNKLSLTNCPIGHAVQDICRAIINNPDSNIISLDFRMIKNFDLDDAHVIADLIRSNKIRELNLENSFQPGLDTIKLCEILLDALAQNSSITDMDLYFLTELLEDEEIYNKLKHVFYTRTIPIKFTCVENVELNEIMNIQLHNYAVSNKTLIQILLEYKK